MPVTVTLFENSYALVKDERNMAMREMVPMLKDTTAGRKEALPWLKLARFGDTRTENGSYRNNANLIEISGIEADYDGEKITIERARQILMDANVAAILYTSPSHTPETPHWRVLCPTSIALPPDRRGALLARVNGLFVGALAPESFTLSQSYYFGAVAGAAHHEVVTIEGRAIDLAADLDAAALGKPVREILANERGEWPSRPPLSEGGTRYGLSALADECSKIASAPFGAQEPTLNGGAYKIGQLVAGDEIEEGTALAELLAAARSLPSQPGKTPWRPAELEQKVRSGLEAGKRDPRSAPMSEVAVDVEWIAEFIQNTKAKATAKMRAAANGAIDAAWSFIDPTRLQGRTVPDREFIVDGWLSPGHVTINFGDGGVGKTLLAQQLMTSCATGAPWCGLAVNGCPSIGLFCEDDADELHRRQGAINIAYGIDFRDLQSMRWASGVGKDNTLVTFGKDGTAAPTAAFGHLLDAAKRIAARLIVVDTAADTFGGDENVRRQVRQYLGHILGKLARELNAAVLLNAHPSRTGLSKDGDLDGGSTAWSNTSRARWSLSRPKVDGTDRADTIERILTRRKANYASIGDTIRLQWKNGVLAPVQRPTGLAAANASMHAEAVFLELLARWTIEQRPVSDNVRAGNYAPKMFAKCPDNQGFGLREFSNAMQSLFAASRIVVQPYGRASDMRHRLAAADDQEMPADAEAA